VHRDVKPENILKRADGSCVLSDFGIARVLHSEQALTQEDTSVGTPQYLSPDQLQGHAVDVLIANAGTMPKPGAFDQQSLDEIDRTLLVNLSSVLWLVHAVLPGMRVKGAGHIVLTGSSAAHAPGANFAAYAASKAALSAFAVGLRGDLAGSGLRVTEIAPGRVETALYESVLPDAARASMYQGGHALQPGDVAEAVLAVVMGGVAVGPGDRTRRALVNRDIGRADECHNAASVFSRVQDIDVSSEGRDGE